MWNGRTRTSYLPSVTRAEHLTRAVGQDPPKAQAHEYATRRWHRSVRDRAWFRLCVRNRDELAYERADPEGEDFEWRSTWT